MSAAEMVRELRALRKQVHYLERQREILSLNRASSLLRPLGKNGLRMACFPGQG
jgi:predicted component of type VI protein secretion system